jgi:hypothetical protein
MDYKKQLYGYIEYEVSPEEGTSIAYFPEGIEVISREVLCDMLKDEKGILHEETVREVVLPDSVRVICDNAFRGFKGLWSVTLNTGGSDLHYIGKYAFAECENLGHFEQSNDLRYIGEGAFYKTKLPLAHIFEIKENTEYVSNKMIEIEEPKLYKCIKSFYLDNCEYSDEQIAVNKNSIFEFTEVNEDTVRLDLHHSNICQWIKIPIEWLEMYFEKVEGKVN